MDNNKKLLHLGNLKTFWKTTEAWITNNLQNLYDQGEIFEKDINSLKQQLGTKEKTIFIHSESQSSYNDADIMNIIKI